MKKTSKHQTSPVIADTRSARMQAGERVAQEFKQKRTLQPTDMAVLIAPFLNLSPGDILLYITWLTYMFVQPIRDMPYIILAVEGPAGSGKYSMGEVTNIFFLSAVSIYSGLFFPVTIPVVGGCDTKADIPHVEETILKRVFQGEKAVVVTGEKVDFKDPLLTTYSIKVTTPPLPDPVPDGEGCGVPVDIAEALVNVAPAFMDHVQKLTEKYTPIKGAYKRNALAAYEIWGKAVSKALNNNDASCFLDHYLKTQFT